MVTGAKTLAGAASEAVPNGLIDMTSLISTGALLIPMDTAFRQRQVQGIDTGSRTFDQGSLQNAAKVRMSEIRLPAAREFIMSGKSRLRFIDPSFELIVLPHTYSIAKLPDSTIGMPVKKVITKNKIDMNVPVNPDPDELFGKRYKLIKNNQLKPIKKNYIVRGIIKT